MRCALVRFTKKYAEGFHIHKLEYIEPDQVDNAILCLQKLRMLSKKVQPNPLIQDGRAHEVFLEAAKRASGDAKRARTLQVAPTDQEHLRSGDGSTVSGHADGSQFMNVRQFSVCMMASRAGDRTAGDLRLRFLRRAQLADVKAYACLEKSSDGLQFVASQSFHYSCCLLQLPLRR